MCGTLSGGHAGFPSLRFQAPGFVLVLKGLHEQGHGRFLDDAFVGRQVATDEGEGAFLAGKDNPNTLHTFLVGGLVGRVAAIAVSVGFRQCKTATFFCSYYYVIILVVSFSRKQKCQRYASTLLTG